MKKFFVALVGSLEQQTLLLQLALCVGVFAFCVAMVKPEPTPTPQPVNYNMTCIDVLNGGDVARCENSEVVCYKTMSNQFHISTIVCRWK